MKTILRLLAVAFIVASVHGCIREDVENCLQYSLKVKAVDVKGNDITANGSVTSVDIYMFDENGFVRMVPQGSADYLLGTDKQKQMTLVAWGNLKSDSLKLPDLKVGTSLTDAQVKLVQMEDGFHVPATDIFYSRHEVKGTATRATMLEETLTLTLERRVAGMTIRTKNLEKKFGKGEPCYFVVYGVGNALNFMGEPTGGTVGYQPKVSHNTLNDGYAPAFRILPTPKEKPLSIRICRGSTVLYTVGKDYRGNTLIATPGEQLDIVIDFMSTDDPTDPDNPGGGDNPGNPDDPNNPDNPGGGDNPGNPDDPNNPDNPGGGGGDPEDPDNPGGGDNPEPSKGTIKVTVNVADWGSTNQDTQVR